MYHLTPVRMAITKSLQIANAGEGTEKQESSSTAGGNANLCSRCGKQYGRSSEN